MEWSAMVEKVCTLFPNIQERGRILALGCEITEKQLYDFEDQPDSTLQAIFSNLAGPNQTGKPCFLAPYSSAIVFYPQDEYL